MSAIRSLDSLEEEFYSVLSRENVDADRAAAITTRVSDVQALLERGLFLNGRTAQGESLLHAACRSNKLDVVKYLVGTKGATLESQDNNLQRPLHVAIKNARYSKVTPLIRYLVEEAGANVNSTENDNKTAIHRVCIENVGRLEEQEIHFMRYFVDHGANLEAKDGYGCTPLHLATRQGTLFLIRFLINEQHVLVDSRNESGFTPLHFAATQARVDPFNYLLSKGADPNAQTKRLVTPLHMACSNGNYAVVRYLLEKENVQIDAQDKYGRAPLHMTGILQVVQLLSRYGATLDLACLDGSTLLHSTKGKDIAEFLVEGSYNNRSSTSAYKMLLARDKQGRSPLDLAEIALKAGLKVSSNEYQLAYYLLSFVKRQLAVPPIDEQHGRKRRMDEVTVELNPRLSRFQRRFAERIRKSLEESRLDEVKYVILGYLSPLDVMNE